MKPPQVSQTQTFEDAFSLHQAGRVAQAKAIYQQLLTEQPGNAELLRLLGTAEYQLGNLQAAVDLLDRSLAISPNQPVAYNNRGNALQGMSRFAEAVASYDLALTIVPDYAEAWSNRGGALKQLKRLDEALASYDKAITFAPDYAMAFSNRGNVLQDMKRLDEALISYDRALALAPNTADAHINRGNVLRDMKRLDEALASYDKALAIAPDAALAHNNRGNVLQDMDRLDEALSAYDRALALAPGYADAYNNIGNVLQAMGYLEEAIAYYDMALAAAPDSAVTLNNRGNALQALRRLEAALASYDQALASAPGYAEAWNNRGNLLQDMRRLDEALASYERALAINPHSATAHKNRGNVLSELKRLEDALDSYETARAIKPDYELLAGECLHTRMKLCRWDNFDADADKLRSMIESGIKAAPPLVTHTLFDAPALQQTCAEIYARHGLPGNPRLVPPAATIPHEKIRIGYFSSDFGDHPVSHLLAGLFEAHDRGQFETFGFSLATRSSVWRERIERAFDHFIDVEANSDLEIVSLARSMEIDIAIDLNGFTQHARTGIFAERAAPIQVSYIGFLGTMGAPYIDYLLADPRIIPDACRPFYTEHIAYLPSYQCNDDKLAVATREFTRQEAGLPEQAFIFCSFNNNHKITPLVFASWIRILKQVPDSVLWLVATTETARQNLRREAEKLGLDSDRLIFASHLPFDQHLSRQKLADLFLDTHPYNAGATASNALRVGLPVLTRSGDSFASRAGASLLHAVGLPELITTTLADYEKLAVELAHDAERLAGIGKRLAANRQTCPLFDTARFARTIESAYFAMHETCRQGLPPADIHIPATP